MLAGKLFTQEDQWLHSCVCQVQSWFLEQRDVDCQQTEGAVWCLFNQFIIDEQ